MLLTKTTAFVVGTFFLLAALFWVLGPPVLSISYEDRLAECEQTEEGDRQVDCVYSIISEELDKGRFESALAVFSAAHRSEIANFNKGECHRHAHNFGHALYYEIYLQKGGFDAVEFPQGSTVCSYGIFHGFIEHLIQDNPSTEFAESTCKYLDAELGDTMRDIKRTCYHASGHGFSMQQAESLEIDDWGNLKKFVNEPLRQCTKLSNAKESELEECREGVFNVAVNWMTDEQYGFRFNYSDPFAQCDKLDTNSHKLCYQEIGRKMDSVSDFDPIALYSMLQNTRHPELAILSLQKGIGGIARRIGYQELLFRCNRAGDELFTECVAGSIGGIYEAGSIQEEYKEPLRVCEFEFVVERGLRNFCYESVSLQLRRFYTKDKIRSICEEFPEDVRNFCEVQIQKQEGE